MKGDFTRDTFDAANHFSRVLMQQGRVQLDADWNEQAAILLHYLQTLAADLIGPHGCRQESPGFTISEAKHRGDSKASDFNIGAGHYYVDGILCENTEDVDYTKQRNYPRISTDTPPLTYSTPYMVYLDVWERHLTCFEQEDTDAKKSNIREVALGGPDTATRAQVVWQVKIEQWQDFNWPNEQAWEKFKGMQQPRNRGKLKALAKKTEIGGVDDPCNIPPESNYRGPENQLYRVEIHKSGYATTDPNTCATFKWSRENGSVVFPIREIGPHEKSVTLDHLGRDARLGLLKGDWVEVVDDVYTLRNIPGQLLQVDKIDYDHNVVTLSGEPEFLVKRDEIKHPLLRRWEGKGAIVEHQVDDSTDAWITLENGVRIQFQASGAGEPVSYHTGDYWLIPARTATGDVEWPGPKGYPEEREPDGVTHHYAPIWIITFVPDTGTIVLQKECRHKFQAL